MIDFSSWIDLPLVWGWLIAVAVFLYVVLDGFDLGCGILFPFAPTHDCRSRMMNSIAPFWDGNETWLVLGGGGLFVAFPLAYAVLMPALYMPIMLMLLGLIFRGVAFEFRFKAGEKDRKLWDAAFHGGSVVAAFMQGVILGNFIHGVEVEGRAFAGGALDWANGFAMATGLAVVFGYALIGATWLVMKTDGETQEWARRAGRYVLVFVAVALGLISLSMPLIDERVAALWFDLPTTLYLLPLPIISFLLLGVIWRDLGRTDHESRPFIATLVIFLFSFIGLGVSLYPWIVPFEFDLWQAAAAPSSQSIMLIGTVIQLPIILGYTAYSYFVFRGKSSHESMY